MRTTRSRWIPAVVLLLPVVEILVMIQVGRLIGFWPTFGVLVALSAIGFSLVRAAGRRAWSALVSDANAGRPPSPEITDNAVQLVGGLILIPPGFVKDVFALVLIMPFTRPLVRRWLHSFALRTPAYVRSQSAGGDMRHGPTSPHGPDVVRGEVVDE